MKKSYFVLVLAVLAIGVFLFTGCSSKTDSSPLELYVSNVDPLASNYSGGAVPVKYTLSCIYSGTLASSSIPSGISLNKMVFAAQDTNGNAISGVTANTLIITSFITVGSSNDIEATDIMWSSLSTYCTANTPGTLVIHATFYGEDSSGNEIQTEADFTLMY